MHVPNKEELRLEELREIEERQKSGRPRSEASRRAILDSTRRLLTYTSVQNLSIESIAKKAGVGKTTIYRWWPNKSAVVLEAVFTQPGFQNILPTAPNAPQGIRLQIEKLVRQLGGKNGRIVAEILGEAQAQPEDIAAFIQAFLQDRYNALAGHIEQGKDEGTFSRDTDTDTAIDLILGPVFFRLMSGQPMDEAFATRHCEMVIRAL